jgi:hypothetical protein
MTDLLEWAETPTRFPSHPCWEAFGVHHRFWVYDAPVKNPDTWCCNTAFAEMATSRPRFTGPEWTSVRSSITRPVKPPSGPPRRSTPASGSG